MPIAWSPSTVPSISDAGAPPTPFVPGMVIAPGGIASAEAFGTPALTRLGFVATRISGIPSSHSGLTTPWMYRTYHFARDDISAVKVAWANYFSQNETASGGNMSLTASVEYPAGTFNQLLFGGSVTGVESTGGLLWSDMVTLSTPIPNGAKFFVRWFVTPAGGLVYSQAAGYFVDTVGGDFVNGTSATDKTMGGTIVNDATSITQRPAAIVAQTAKRTLLLVGDSRTSGAADSVVDTSGDLGELERPLGPSYAYCNVSLSGGSMPPVVANHARRVELSKYATTVLCNLGANDIQLGSSAASMESSLTSIRALFSQQEFWGVTISPWTQGSWTAADGSDQTIPSPGGPNRLLLNTWLRGSSGFTGFLEVASQLALVADASKWKADGTVGKYTVDGLHGTPFANKTLVLTLP